MQNFVVYCPNIACGTNERRNDERRSDERRNNERPDLSNNTPAVVVIQLHRRLEYRGSRKIGFFDMTIFHYYECPVCGREVIYAEKNGVKQRCDVEGQYSTNNG